MKLRILLAEDDQFARLGMRQLIRSRTPHQIVGEAANGEEAVRLVLAKKPDMVIMDAAMPGMDGEEATRHMLEMKDLTREPFPNCSRTFPWPRPRRTRSSTLCRDMHCLPRQNQLLRFVAHADIKARQKI